MFFETADDSLAAFLALRGCQRVGFGIGEATDPLPAITHIFDDVTVKLLPAVSAFQYGLDDEVAAGRYIRMKAFLQKIRMDEALRRYRETESDLAKVREPDDE